MSGCGSTKWSDTARTGTEQLLISNAIDNAVDKIDFTPIREKKVYLKTEAIESITDNKYLTMALRQQLAACGGILCDEVEHADYIVEARAGAVGTDRDDMLLLGIPSMTVPWMSDATLSSATIPEVPIIKRTKQRGVAKIAVFAYNRHTGRPLWASGNNQYESTAQNLWFAGSGPLARGTIYEEPTYAGHPLPGYLLGGKKDRRQPSFADGEIVFKETPGVPRLKDSLPNSPETADKTEVAETSPISVPPSPSTGPPPVHVPPASPYAVPVYLPDSPPGHQAAPFHGAPVH